MDKLIRKNEVEITVLKSSLNWWRVCILVSGAIVIGGIITVVIFPKTAETWLQIVIVLLGILIFFDVWYIKCCTKWCCCGGCALNNDKCEKYQDFVAFSIGGHTTSILSLGGIMLSGVKELRKDKDSRTKVITYYVVGLVLIGVACLLTVIVVIINSKFKKKKVYQRVDEANRLAQVSINKTERYELGNISKEIKQIKQMLQQANIDEDE